MSITRTQNILDAHLKAIPGLPTWQAENTVLKVSQLPAVRSTLNPAQSNVTTIGYNAIRELQGLYQVDCLFPADTGLQAAKLLADTIVDSFKPGDMFSDDKITVVIRVSSVMAASIFDKIYMVPVRIQWSVYTQS